MRDACKVLINSKKTIYFIVASLFWTLPLNEMNIELSCRASVDVPHCLLVSGDDIWNWQNYYNIADNICFTDSTFIIQPQINIFFDQSRVTQKKWWRWCLFHHDQWTMLTSSCRYIVHKIINICSYDPCFLSESFTFNVTKKHNSRDILLLTNYSFVLFQIPLFKLVLAFKFTFSKHYRAF